MDILVVASIALLIVALLILSLDYRRRDTDLYRLLSELDAVARADRERLTREHAILHRLRILEKQFNQALLQGGLAKLEDTLDQVENWRGPLK